MKTYMAKSAEAAADRKWWVVDAKDQPLGRLASRVATILRGKHKPGYTPHVDGGDFVIIINAEKIKVTGAKRTEKMYYRHSGYPGAIREESFEHLVIRHPELPIQKAVKGMLPKSVLGRQLITKLKIYATDKHPHQAQKPVPLAL